MVPVGVLLAAGRAKRFRSSRSKVLHELYGKPLILHVIDYLKRGGCEEIIVVTSPTLEGELRGLLPEWVRLALQVEPRGTGDAVRVAYRSCRGCEAFVVTNGDVPLVRPSTVKSLISMGRDAHGVVTAVNVPDPKGYGRVLTIGDSFLIREESELSGEERSHSLVNAGLYYISSELIPLIDEIPPAPNGEIYLTHLFEIAHSKGFKVKLMVAEDWREFIGVNRREDLSRAFKLASQMRIEELWEIGVTVLDPDTTYISPDTTVERDAVIYPNTYLESCHIGSGATVGPNVVAIRSHVGANTVVVSSHLVEAEVGTNSKVGPFAYLRPGTKLLDNSKVGTFVEVKNSTVGKGSKVPHLSYIGDATIGANVNVGAGTITCNYDGFSKHPTVIEDEAFIGSNTSLVAPVRVGKGAVTGAGSVVTKDIPPEEVWVGNPARFLKTRDELKRKLMNS